MSSPPSATDDDRLAALKAQVAYEHLGNASLRTRLRGGNRRQLVEDAEALRAEAGLRETGERYSLRAAIYVAREGQRRALARIFER